VETYVIIHGAPPHHLKSDAELRDYVTNIVYGMPSRVFAVLLQERRFVALVEWPEDQARWADGTFRRMPSFPYGCQLTLTADVAWREFGSWVAHHSGVSTPLKETLATTYAADRQLVADMEADGLL